MKLSNRQHNQSSTHGPLITKQEIKKAQQKLEEWRKSHEDINVLRKAYQEKILDWVVKSMEFEVEPLSMTRLKELLALSQRT